MSEVYSAGNLHGASRSDAGLDCNYWDVPRPAKGTSVADSCIIPINPVNKLAFGMRQRVYTCGQTKANTIGAAVKRFQAPKFGLRPMCLREANTALSRAFCCTIWQPLLKQAVLGY